jgi:hypothetical protein
MDARHKAGHEVEMPLESGAIQYPMYVRCFGGTLQSDRWLLERPFVLGAEAEPVPRTDP